MCSEDHSSLRNISKLPIAAVEHHPEAEVIVHHRLLRGGCQIKDAEARCAERMGRQIRISAAQVGEETHFSVKNRTLTARLVAPDGATVSPTASCMDRSCHFMAGNTPSQAAVFLQRR
jgi:hypothetical protein